MYLIYLPVKSVRVVLSGRCPYVNLYLHLLNFPPWFFSKVVQDCQKFLTWNSMVATTTSILGNASKMLAAIAKVGIKIVDKKAAFFKELHFIIFNFWMMPTKRSFRCKFHRYLFILVVYFSQHSPKHCTEQSKFSLPHFSSTNKMCLCYTCQLHIQIVRTNKFLSLLW